MSVQTCTYGLLRKSADAGISLTLYTSRPKHCFSQSLGHNIGPRIHVIHCVQHCC